MSTHETQIIGDSHSSQTTNNYKEHTQNSTELDSNVLHMVLISFFLSCLHDFHPLLKTRISRFGFLLLVWPEWLTQRLDVSALVHSCWYTAHRLTQCLCCHNLMQLKCSWLNYMLVQRSLFWVISAKCTLTECGEFSSMVGSWSPCPMFCSFKDSKLFLPSTIVFRSDHSESSASIWVFLHLLPPTQLTSGLLSLLTAPLTPEKWRRLTLSAAQVLKINIRKW